MLRRTLSKLVRNDVLLTHPTATYRYVGKLRTDLESFAGDVFTAPSARDRVQSILADLKKTAGDFDAIAARAVEQLANGLMPRIR